MLAGSFGGGGAQVPAYSVCAIYVVYLFVGMFSMFRSLPFAFALGVSRRSYYGGTVLLAAGLAAIYGLLLTVAEDPRGGQRRLGRGPALLPGALHPGRAVVPDLAHLVRRA